MIKEPFKIEEEKEDDNNQFEWLKFDQTKSLLDDLLKDCKAQYDTGNITYPLKCSWDKCKTKLKDLDTSKTHFVQGFSEKLIVIDFDKKGPDGKKDLQSNMKAASKWTPTYAELSNSGAAIHLMYWYDGNPNDLSSLFDDEIEIKVFPDNKSLALRRRVSKCNDLPIAHISSGLPLKEKKNMVNWEGLKNDKHLRNTIEKIIRKEIDIYGASPKTITCMKSIRDILDQAKDQNLSYDLRDMDNVIEAFAMHSHNNSKECMDIYYGLDLVWPKEPETSKSLSIFDKKKEDNKPIIILDCEVVQNLTLVVYKELESDSVPAILKKPKDRQKKCVRMFNPSANKIAELLDNTRMVGHNVTKYDNYILYALMLGKTPEEICQLSHQIIKSPGRTVNVPYGWHVAKDLSYTDTYDASNNRRGLKKIEIEMHIPHKEMEIDWSEPLPESEWDRLAEYCENDVLATEAFFLSKEFQTDFKARKILAALTGMTVNDSTNNLTMQLIFGDVKKPQSEFNCPDLKKLFPEYRFDERTHRSYYGNNPEPIGEGGRVYAQWGAYYDVITFDVASMHPSSIIVENGFGPYTKHYEDLLKARIAIKHKDYESARKMFDGRLAPYLESDEDADALSHALKIALNSVYGMTAASYEGSNRFKDPRNIDNWVAKRGALFMEKLRHEVIDRGGKVVHIKTDSIKLEKPSKELSDFVIEFGKKYGYTFEIESHYERMCLVNNAVYIALRAKDDPSWLKECKKAKERAEKTETPYIEPTRWTATGAQFAQPYVFKRVFSHEPLVFEDFCEVKQVKTSLYLDLNERLPDVTLAEKEKKKIETRIKKLNKDLFKSDLSDVDREKIERELKDLPKDIEVLDEEIAKGHAYTFIGSTGEFTPVVPGAGGGLLMRKEDDGGFGFATGAKGFRWLESDDVSKLPDWKKYIDIRYFRGLVDTARETISAYCDPVLFIRGEDGIILPEEQIVEYDVDPWMMPCKTEKYAYCSDCPDFMNNEDGSCSCKQGYDISKQILGESKETIL